MNYYAGIDVSLECSSVCVVDGTGKIAREAKVASEPEALIAWFGSLGLSLERIGLEAGPLSQWLYAALREVGLAVALLETRHVKAALSAMPVKTDRNDARGIAQLMRLGWFRPVHCKSAEAQEIRALLTARKLVQSRLYDVEMSLRGILRGFGLKVGRTTPKRFAERIRELVVGMQLWKRWARRCCRSMPCCCANSTASRSGFGRSLAPTGRCDSWCQRLASARSWGWPMSRRSTILHGSSHPSRWGRILG